MKKRPGSMLISVTLLFAAFTLGFFLGRNTGRTPPVLSVPEELLTEPAATEDHQETTASPETAPAVTFPIDLNAATEEELTALPGIGPVLARRILDYRGEFGAFTAVEELMNVEGIGEKRMDAIWDLVTIGGKS